MPVQCKVIVMKIVFKNGGGGFWGHKQKSNNPYALIGCLKNLKYLVGVKYRQRR